MHEPTIGEFSPHQRQFLVQVSLYDILFWLTGGVFGYMPEATYGYGCIKYQTIGTYG